jgi:hypothetical protein
LEKAFQVQFPAHSSLTMRVEVTSSIAIDHEELAEASVISKTGKKYADGCLNFRIWRWMSQSDGWQPSIGQQPDLFFGEMMMISRPHGRM